VVAACAACRFWLIKSAEWSPRQTEGWRAHSSLRAGCLSVWAAVMKMSGKRKGPSAQGLSTRSVCVFASLCDAQGANESHPSSIVRSLGLCFTHFAPDDIHYTRRTRNESTSRPASACKFSTPCWQSFLVYVCLLVARCESVGGMDRRRAPLWRLLIQFCNGKCFQLWPNSRIAFAFLTRRGDILHVFLRGVTPFFCLMRNKFKTPTDFIQSNV
jgi:hypothetical protein